MAPSPPNILLRGLRVVIPSGYIVGRTAMGSGDAELISFGTLANLLTATGSISGGGGDATNSYLGFFLQGPFAISKVYVGAISHSDVTFPSAIISSTAQALIASTGTFSIYLVNDLAAFQSGGPLNGCIAQISFTAGNPTGTITWFGSTVVSAGTILYVCFPADFDATLREIMLLFAGDL